MRTISGAWRWRWRRRGKARGMDFIRYRGARGDGGGITEYEPRIHRRGAEAQPRKLSRCNGQAKRSLEPIWGGGEFTTESQRHRGGERISRKRTQRTQNQLKRTEK